MTLSEHAEEILEALWIAVEEEGADSLDPRKLDFPCDDPAYRELTDRAMIELRQGLVYFRPEGLEEGKMSIRRHRLAERLIMDIFNIRGEDGDLKACQFEHLLKDGVDTKLCTMLNHPATCPHGKAIPPGACCDDARAKGDLGVVPLTEFKPGQEGEIAYIQTGDNKKILVQSYPSYIFRIGFSEFAVDTALAMEIFVRKQ